MDEANVNKDTGNTAVYFSMSFFFFKLVCEYVALENHWYLLGCHQPYVGQMAL